MQIIYDHALKYSLSSTLSNSVGFLAEHWVNLATTKGYTALHFAAYHGNVQMIKFLVEELNADINAKTSLGQNVLHFGAQGDKPATIVYFTQLKMEIGVKDNKKRTPLHWAVTKGSNLSLEYILAHS